jgi:hypothetical protein
LKFLKRIPHTAQPATFLEELKKKSFGRNAKFGGKRQNFEDFSNFWRKRQNFEDFSNFGSYFCGQFWRPLKLSQISENLFGYCHDSLHLQFFKNGTPTTFGLAYV